MQSYATVIQLLPSLFLKTEPQVRAIVIYDECAREAQLEREDLSCEYSRKSDEEVFIVQLHRRAKLLNDGFQQRVLDIIAGHAISRDDEFKSNFLAHANAAVEFTTVGPTDSARSAAGQEKSPSIVSPDSEILGLTETIPALNNAAVVNASNNIITMPESNRQSRHNSARIYQYGTLECLSTEHKSETMDGGFSTILTCKFETGFGRVEVNCFLK